MTTMRWALSGMALAAVAAAAGCGQAGQISNGEATLPSEENSAAFLDRMSSQNTVSENDAMRGVLMVLEGKDTARTFEQRVEVLRSRGVVEANWTFDASRPITRGKLAYMIWTACKMPGGVILTLTGPSRRYCLRELQYHDMMADGSEFTEVTGMEYVAVLTRADTFVRTGRFPSLTGDVEEEG